MSDIDLDREWPCFGAPDSIAIDNGLDFTSNGVAMACLQLGTEVMRMPPRTPWYKGTIERFGGTMNVRFIHWLPGSATGIEMRNYEYDPEATASITYDDFCRLFERYVVTIHNKTPRRNKPGTPIERFLSGTQAWPVRLPEDIEDFNAVFALTVQKRVGQGGFEYEHERYNSAELGEIWNQMPAGSEVTVRVDPTDIRRVFVIDPRTDRAISVPCLTEYAAPRPLALHKMVWTYLLAHDLNPESAEHRVLAEQKLADDINEASEKGKKLRKQFAQLAVTVIDGSVQQAPLSRNQTSLMQDQGISDLQARMAAARRLTNGQ